jgi:hypothetical protein
LPERRCVERRLVVCGSARGGATPFGEGWRERLGRTGAKRSAKPSRNSGPLHSTAMSRPSTDRRHLGFLLVARSKPAAMTGAWSNGLSCGPTKDGRTSRRSAGDAASGGRSTTRDVRGCDVGFGSPSRRAQGVRSQRERLVTILHARNVVSGARAAPDRFAVKAIMAKNHDIPRRKAAARTARTPAESHAATRAMCIA